MRPLGLSRPMRHILLIALLFLGVAGSGARAGAREDQLLRAVRSDDHAGVRMLLARRANPNIRLADKST